MFALRLAALRLCEADATRLPLQVRPSIVQVAAGLVQRRTDLPSIFHEPSLRDGRAALFGTLSHERPVERLMPLSSYSLCWLDPQHHRLGAWTTDRPCITHASRYLPCQKYSTDVKKNTALKTKQQQFTVPVFLSSPNMLIDPYNPNPPPMPPILSRAFYEYVKTRFRSFMIQIYGRYLLQKFCFPKWSEKEFIRRVGLIYGGMNKNFASGSKKDVKSLRTLVTEGLLQGLERKLKDREAGERHEWTLHGIDETKIIRIRYSPISETDLEKLFFQITTRIKSRQSLAIYDARGALIGGSPEQVVAVTDVVVFERALYQTNSEWRICKIFGAD